MGVNNPRYTVEIDTHIKDITKELNKNKKQLIDFKKTTENLSLGDELAKQLQVGIDKIDQLQKEYVESIEQFAKGKLSTKQFDEFTKKFEADMDGIMKRMINVEDTISELSIKLKSFNGTENLSRKFKDLQTQVKNFMRDMKDGITVLKDFNDLTNMHNSSRSLKSIEKTISRLNGIDINKKSTSIIEDNIGKLTKDLITAYNSLDDIEEKMDKAKSLKYLRKYQDEYVDTLRIVEQTSKRIAQLTDGKSIAKTDTIVNYDGIEYHIQDIATEIQDIQDGANGLVESLINAKQKIIDQAEALEKGASTIAESFHFEDGGIKIPVILDPHSKQFLEEQTKELIEVLNKYAESNPVNVTFRLFPMTGSQADTGAVSKSIKDVRAEIEKIEDPELKEKFTNFSNKLEKQYQQALKLRIAVEISQTADDVKRDIEMIKRVVHDTKIDSINLSFDVDPEEEAKVKSKLDDIQKGFSNNIVERLTKLSESLNKLLDDQRVKTWSNAFVSALTEIQTKLEGMKDLIKPLADLTVSQKVKGKRGRPAKETIDNRSIVDNFTVTMDLLRKSLEERKKLPKLNVEEFTQEIQDAVDRADIPVSVPVEPNLQGFAEQIESELKSVPINVVLGGVTGGGNITGATFVVNGADVTLENSEVEINEKDNNKTGSNKGGSNKGDSTKGSSNKKGTTTQQQEENVDPIRRIVNDDFLNKEYSKVLFKGKRIQTTDAEKEAKTEFDKIYSEFKDLMKSLPTTASAMEHIDGNRSKIERELALDPNNKELEQALAKYEAESEKKLKDYQKKLDDNNKKIAEFKEKYPFLADFEFNQSRSQRDKMFNKYLESKGIERTSGVSPNLYLRELKDEIAAKGDFKGKGAKAQLTDFVKRFIGFEYLDKLAEQNAVAKQKSRGDQTEKLAVKEFTKAFDKYFELRKGKRSDDEKIKANSIAELDELIKQFPTLASIGRTAKKKVDFDEQLNAFLARRKENLGDTGEQTGLEWDSKRNKAKKAYKVQGWKVTNLSDNPDVQKKLLNIYNKLLGITEDNTKAKKDLEEASEETTRISMFEGQTTEELKNKYEALKKQKEDLSGTVPSDLVTDLDKDKEDINDIVAALERLRTFNKKGRDYRKQGLINAEGMSKKAAQAKGFHITESGEIEDAVSFEETAQRIVKSFIESYDLPDDIFKGINQKSKAKLNELGKDILGYKKLKDISGDIDNEMKKISTELDLREKEAAEKAKKAEEAAKKAEEAAKKKEKSKKKNTETKKESETAPPVDPKDAQDIKDETEALDKNTESQKKNDAVRKENPKVREKLLNKINKEKKKGGINLDDISDNEFEAIVNVAMNTITKERLGAGEGLSVFKEALDSFREVRGKFNANAEDIDEMVNETKAAKNDAEAHQELADAKEKVNEQGSGQSEVKAKQFYNETKAIEKFTEAYEKYFELKEKSKSDDNREKASGEKQFNKLVKQYPTLSSIGDAAKDTIDFNAQLKSFLDTQENLKKKSKEVADTVKNTTKAQEKLAESEAKAAESASSETKKSEVKVKQFLNEKNAIDAFTKAYKKYFTLREKKKGEDKEAKAKATEDMDKLLTQYPTLKSIGNKKQENVNFDAQLKSFIVTQTQLSKSTDKATESTEKNTKSEKKNKQAKEENKKATEDLSKSEQKRTVQVDRYLNKNNAIKDFKTAYDKYFDLRDKTDDKSVNSKNKLLERFPTLKNIGNKKQDKVSYDDELNKFLQTQTKLREANAEAAKKEAEAISKSNKSKNKVSKLTSGLEKKYQDELKNTPDVNLSSFEGDRLLNSFGEELFDSIQSSLGTKDKLPNLIFDYLQKGLISSLNQIEELLSSNNLERLSDDQLQSLKKWLETEKAYRNAHPNIDFLTDDVNVISKNLRESIAEFEKELDSAKAQMSEDKEQNPNDLAVWSLGGWGFRNTPIDVGASNFTYGDRIKKAEELIAQRERQIKEKKEQLAKLETEEKSKIDGITQAEKELQKVQEQGNHFQGLIDRINKYDEEKVKINDLKDIYKEYVELVNKYGSDTDGDHISPIQDFLINQLDKHGYKFDESKNDAFRVGKNGNWVMTPAARKGFGLKQNTELAELIGANWAMKELEKPDKDYEMLVEISRVAKKNTEEETKEVTELIDELYRLNEAQEKIDDIASDKWFDNINKQIEIGNKLTKYFDYPLNPTDQINPDYYAEQYGEKYGKQYVKGVESQVDEAKQAGADLGNAVNEGAADETETHSPSKVAERLGEYWGIGYAQGIKKHKNDVEDAVRELVNTGKLTAEDLQKDLDTLLSGGFGKNYKALQDPLSNILADSMLLEKTKNIAKTGQKVMSGKFKGIHSTLLDNVDSIMKNGLNYSGGIDTTIGYLESYIEGAKNNKGVKYRVGQEGHDAAVVIDLDEEIAELFQKTKGIFDRIPGELIKGYINQLTGEFVKNPNYNPNFDLVSFAKENYQKYLSNKVTQGTGQPMRPTTSVPGEEFLKEYISKHDNQPEITKTNRTLKGVITRLNNSDELSNEQLDNADATFAKWINKAKELGMDITKFEQDFSSARAKFNNSAEESLGKIEEEVLVSIENLEDKRAKYLESIKNVGKRYLGDDVVDMVQQTRIKETKEGSFRAISYKVSGKSGSVTLDPNGQIIATREPISNDYSNEKTRKAEIEALKKKYDKRDKLLAEQRKKNQKKYDEDYEKAQKRVSEIENNIADEKARAKLKDAIEDSKQERKKAEQLRKEYDKNRKNQDKQYEQIRQKADKFDESYQKTIKQSEQKQQDYENKQEKEARNKLKKESERNNREQKKLNDEKQKRADQYDKDKRRQAEIEADIEAAKQKERQKQALEESKQERKESQKLKNDFDKKQKKTEEERRKRDEQYAKERDKQNKLNTEIQSIPDEVTQKEQQKQAIKESQQARRDAEKLKTTYDKKQEQDVNNLLEKRVKLYKECYELQLEAWRLDPEENENRIYVLEDKRRQKLKELDEITDEINKKNPNAITYADHVKQIEKADEDAIYSEYLREADDIDKTNQKKIAEASAKAYDDLSAKVKQYIILKKEIAKGKGLEGDEDKAKNLLEDINKINDSLKNSKLFNANLEAKSTKGLDTIDEEVDRIVKQIQKQQTSKYQDRLQSQLTDVQFERDYGKHTETFNNELDKIITEAKRLQGIDVFSDQDIEDAKTLLETIKRIRKEGGLTTNKVANENSVQKNLQQINSILSENTKGSFRKTDVYQSLVNLQKTFKTFDTSRPQSELADLTTTLLKTKAQFEELDDSVKGKGFFGLFADRLRGINAQFLAQYFSWQDFIRYGRTAVSTIIDLDTQLVDLRKTTKMNNDELEEFYQNSNDVAKQMGVTTSEIISQAAAWSRLGFNTKEQSTEMAKLSSMFTSISPGMDTESSTDYLVSTIQAYGLEVDEVQRKVLDNVNAVGNAFATTNAEIGEMLTRSSAAMKEANNSLEETIALETAAVEVTRNAERTGTAFRTVSMRIRGYDEEGEDGELLEDYEELKGKIADLTKTAKTPGGISLFTDETKQTYKSTYQLLKEISEIYHDLTDKEQAGLLEALAGKRGGQVLAPILSDFSQVDKAMETMEGAAGSAEKEMGIIRDSLEFKINEIKQTWVGVLQDITDRGGLGKILDLLNNISEALGNIVSNAGLVKTAFIGIATVIGSRKLG